MKILKKLNKVKLQLALLMSLLWLSSCALTQKNNEVLLLMKTNKGDVEIALYPDKAPLTVANFLKYIDAGHFNAGTFYRVVRFDNDNGAPKISVIQGGARPGSKDWPAIALETTEQTGVMHLDGTLSMARAEPNTATSAFFICIGPQPSLDFGGKRAKDGLGFAAFGRVVKGMDIVKAINNIRQAKPTDNAYMKGQMLLQPVIIESFGRL